MILFLVGASGLHIRCCLNPVEVSILLFRSVWWLECLPPKESPSAFCSVRWLLEVFLAVAEFVGLRAGGRLPFEWLYWIRYCPFVGPPCPSRLLPKFSTRKEHESWSFQSIPLLINSMSLKRDGVRICLGKDVERLSFEGFLLRHRLYTVPITLDVCIKT